MNRQIALLALAIAALGVTGCSVMAPQKQESAKPTTSPETFGYKLSKPVVDTSVRTDLTRRNSLSFSRLGNSIMTVTDTLVTTSHVRRLNSWHC